jgi:hypothetical protein
MAMFTAMARWLFSTDDNIATPCSVKARGVTEECFNSLNRSQFVTSSSFSFFVSRNMKSGGNLRAFLLTA